MELPKIYPLKTVLKRNDEGALLTKDAILLENDTFSCNAFFFASWISNIMRFSKIFSGWTHLQYVKFRKNPLTIKRNIAKIQEPVFFGSPYSLNKK